MSFIPKNLLKPIDHWETPSCYITEICKFVTNKRILDPFYSQGRVKKVWEELGFDITHVDGVNFFDLRTADITEDVIISNIPFSKKNQCIERLFELGVPFMVLCPITTLAYVKTQRIIKKHKIQIIIPTNCIGFIDPTTGLQSRRAPFYLVWICYKINLQNDITYL